MIGDSISVISAIGAIIAALVTYYLFIITRRNLIYQVLVNLQMEYRSPQMQYAVMTLRDFYRDECDKDEETLMKKYGEKYDEEKEWLEKQKEKYFKRQILQIWPKEKPVEALETTLDYQRRLVSHFYDHLATLYTNNIVPSPIIFATWSEKDLSIIPKIIIPMENKLTEILYKDSKEPQPPPLDESSKLYQLYIDSKEYE